MGVESKMLDHRLPVPNRLLFIGGEGNEGNGTDDDGIDTMSLLIDETSTGRREHKESEDS